MLTPTAWYEKVQRRLFAALDDLARRPESAAALERVETICGVTAVAVTARRVAAQQRRMETSISQDQADGVSVSVSEAGDGPDALSRTKQLQHGVTLAVR